MTNAVKNYFKEQEPDNGDGQAVETQIVSVYVNTDDLQKVDIEVPIDADEDSFVRGYVAGLDG